MTSSLTIVAIERLRAFALQVELERAEDMPWLDLAWLRARCDDTLLFTGQYQQASIRQLRLDINDFVAEFPNVLPMHLIEELGALDQEG